MFQGIIHVSLHTSAFILLRENWGFLRHAFRNTKPTKWTQHRYLCSKANSVVILKRSSPFTLHSQPSSTFTFGKYKKRWKSRLPIPQLNYSLDFSERLQGLPKHPKGKKHFAMLATLHLIAWLPKLLWIIDAMTSADNDVYPFDVTTPNGVIFTPYFPHNWFCPIDPKVKSIKIKCLILFKKAFVR
jgi:hypothetical protein